jgi:glutamate dehydrogenase/leucine dehydrogenase
LEPTDLHPAEDPRKIVEYNILRAAGRLGLDNEMRTLLNMPFREIRVEIPLRMDDGSLRVFVGYRVQRAGCTFFRTCSPTRAA